MVGRSFHENGEIGIIFETKGLALPFRSVAGSEAGDGRGLGEMKEGQRGPSIRNYSEPTRDLVVVIKREMEEDWEK
jgi:hypothetical protein